MIRLIDKTGFNESTTITEERQECEKKIFAYFENLVRYKYNAFLYYKA